MTLNSPTPEHHNEQIDSTLRVLGSAVPTPGMEERILVRLADAGAQATPQRFFSFPQLAVGVMATVLGGAVIIVGSVTHSRHMLPVAPGIHLPGATQAGVGAASAAHVATHPVPALPASRPRSVRKAVNGRAVISPDTRKHNGLPVPQSSLNAH